MRELAPSLRFPVREPAGALARVEHPTSEREWRAYIGARVLVTPSGRGGGKDRFRPVPARLVAVDGLRGEVSLPHHKGTEWVPLSCLKRWVKGEHEDAARIEAHARRNGDPIPFQAPTPTTTEAPMIAHAMPAEPALHGTESPTLAAYESQRSAAKGKVLIRDALTGKYWVGGKPGTLFDAKLHGFVASINDARLTSAAAADIALRRFADRVGTYRLEYLTVEQASIHYGDRHPVLDMPKEHTPELMPREVPKAEAKPAPERTPEPAPKARDVMVAPVNEVAQPGPAQPNQTNLERMRANMDALEAAIRNKATADAMAASEGIEVRKCEELLRVAKLRIELGL